MELLIRPVASRHQSAENYRPPAAWTTEAEGGDLHNTDQHLVIGIANRWRAYELRLSREEVRQLIRKAKAAWAT